VTVLGALVRGSLESPNTPLSSAHLADWAGGARSDAGVAVTEKRVYGLPAYYRAVAVTAGSLAGLPIHVFVNGTRERVRQRTVLDNPNPRQTPFEYWFTAFANALSWGNAFALKIRDRGGVVREAWPIHPSRVVVCEVRREAAVPDGKVFEVTFPDGTQGRFTSLDVFHLPYLSLDGISGIRPLDLFRQSLGIAIAAEDTSARFYGSGAMVSGALSTDQPLKDEQAKRLKARWKSLLSGPKNAGDIVVLDRGTKFERVALPPGDAQLLESRKWSVTEIARMVGVPPHVIGDVERSTSWGTGIEQQTLGWVKFDLQSWVSLWEQRVTRELLPGGWSSGNWYAEASLEGLLRGDSKARAEFYRIMTSIGAMKLTRVQELENEEPDPTVDFYTLPKNMDVLRPGDDDEMSPADRAAIVQKAYLGTEGKVVITAGEARALAGFDPDTGPGTNQEEPSGDDSDT
jgi:HK97 family phage portal protein